MIAHYVIALAALAGIFVLFLVLSRTLNAIINHLNRLEYLLGKERQLLKETLAIKRLMTEQEKHRVVGESAEANPE